MGLQERTNQLGMVEDWCNRSKITVSLRELPKDWQDTNASLRDMESLQLNST